MYVTSNNKNVSDMVKIISSLNCRSNINNYYRAKSSRFQEAFNKVLNMSSNDTILFYNESKYHDGYDSYGPQSDIYDFHLIKESNNELIYEKWHGEDWYNGSYQFEMTETFKIISMDSLVSILKHSDLHFTHRDYKRFFEMSKFVKNDFNKYSTPSRFYIGTEIDGYCKKIYFLEKDCDKSYGYSLSQIKV